MRTRWTSGLAIALTLAGCGGGGGGGGTSTVGATATVTPAATPTPTAAAGCTLRERQNWALAQLREWYLFPETLPASLDPTPYADVQSYVDALTATARSQRRDRFFTYVTSIASEDAYYNSGATAGFGFRLATDSVGGRVTVMETFENTPALAANLDRGTQILAIGTAPSDLRTVSAIISAEGSGGVTNALGPNTPGTTRLLRVVDATGAQRDVTVSKADYALLPVSTRYGAKIIADNGGRYGYLNLRTFISTADAPLRQAFADFRAAGVTSVVIDLRYNGGGLVSTAELVGDLLGAARSTSDVLDYTTFRPEKASNNTTRFVQPKAQSIAPMRLAFIGTGATASASELVVNAQIPYLHANAALVGTNTYGKPVGQIALDRAACDDRFRVIAFKTENAARQGDYYNGLATVVEASCAAGDDLTRQLGDPAEASTRAALTFLQTGSCGTRIGATGEIGTLSLRAAPRELLTPDQPSTAQRETPGLF